MATTQYIGARYVPLFFTNPDDNSNNWKSGIAYDPLTVVMDLNQSYTSKIPVPATVGRPSENPTYWIMTASYNAQISQLSTRVSELDDKIDTETGTLSTRMENLADRYFVLLGDSFGSGINGDNNRTFVTGGGWADRCAAMINAGGGHAYRNTRALSGMTGFASSGRFYDMFDAIIEDYVTDPTLITDVVVLGGTNDIAVASEVPAAITEFYTHVKSVCPHAMISIGEIGSSLSQLFNTIRPQYKTVETLGGRHIGSLAALFLNPDYIGTDNTHLTLAGYQHYAPTICNTIVGGSDDWYEGFNIPVTPASGVNGGAPTLYTSYNSKGITINVEMSNPTAINVETLNPNGATLTLGTLGKRFNWSRGYSKIWDTIWMKRPTNQNAVYPDHVGFIYHDASDNTLKLTYASALGGVIDIQYAFLFVPWRESVYLNWI